MLFLLYTNLLTRSLPLIMPSHLQPIILFFGQFIQFWKSNVSYLTQICYPLHKILNVLNSEQLIPAEEFSIRDVTDSVLTIILRLLKYVYLRFPMAQRMDESSQKPSQFDNTFTKGDQNGRTAVLFQGQWLTRDKAVYEIGDELIVEKVRELILQTLWSCRLLNLTCHLMSRFEKESITQEKLMKVSDCVIYVFRILSMYEQPLVLSIKYESKVNEIMDEILNEVVVSLLYFQCCYLHFLLNRIIPVYVDLLLKNRYLENVLLFFRTSLSQTLIQNYILQEVSNRFDVFFLP